ncbi:MAG: UDP-N-acetylmuramoyl-L-alanine--D-glutamate ligase, partial [Chloroflexi bacterium]|nr:UDP-N-acetylmuramoyl-L-alanine--D-glutamate ligase [Chloroflexota bacterium]
DGAVIYNNQIWLRNGHETAVCHVDDIQLRGKHNLLNVLAAVTLADSVGISTKAMAEAIRTFKGVEHRLELVRTRNGVQWINDSIATAPERALAAVHAFNEPLILLAGGRDKEMEWDMWAEQVSQHCKQVILFGELAELLEQKLVAQNASNFSRVNSMEDAVELGMETAVSGNVVLLSPGGTSFDAFVDFAKRGEIFRELVNGL